MKIMRTLLIAAFIAIVAIGLSLIVMNSSAERRGEDSDPPEHGDWIIDSPGNYIGNETEWVEIIENTPPAEPTVIEHNDNIEIDGNILIKDGGELTLYNTTINMTDDVGYSIFIEEGGTLIMQLGVNESQTKIHNGLGGRIGTFEIEGTLIMNQSTIEDPVSMYVNSSSPTLDLTGSNFYLFETCYLLDQNPQFTGVTIQSASSSALVMFNTTIEWNGGGAISMSNTTDQDVLSMTVSTINSQHLFVSSSSDFNACLYMEQSTFNSTNGSSFSTGQTAVPIRSTNSYIHLWDNIRIRSKGDLLMDCDDSVVIINDANFGYHYWFVNSFVPGLHFEDSQVTFEDVNFFRIRDTAFLCEDTDLMINNCNFWNITGNAIDLDGGTLTVNNSGFWNINGDALFLDDVTANIMNSAFDEDDRNFTYGVPWPPIYSGIGYGILGHPIIVQDSDIGIVNCSFASFEMNAVHAVDCTIDIRESAFRSPGIVETDKIHGIYLENSTGDIMYNKFNTPYRGQGFDVFSMNLVPMDITEFIENNNFSDGRNFRQEFTLNVRVVNGDGDGVSDAEVNMTNNVGEGEKASSSIVGGWIRTPFLVPSFEIFRHVEHNNQTNETTVTFENKTYNDYYLVIVKEYSTYNFSVTTDLFMNLTSSMNIEVLLNVTVPDLMVKSAGIFPQTLQGEEIEIIIVVRNLGEKAVQNVNISYYYALNDTQDWIWFGSDVKTIPGLFNGGNHTQFTTFIPVYAPLGDYNFLINIDPEDSIPERDETNNNFTTPQGFQVFTRPRIFIDHPQTNDKINGTYVISGYAEDDYNGNIQVEMMIDDTAISVADVTQAGETVLWNYNWDTTIYEPTQGRDKYPNGEHTLSVRCTNDNPPGYDMSDWFNITVTITNAPILSFLHPTDMEFINVTGSLPLYPVEVKVHTFHDLSSVKFRVDDGPLQAMNLAGSTFKSMFDTSKYSDGYHTVTYEAIYGYGNVSETVTVLINSPNEDTLPSVDTTYLLEDEGLTVQGIATDDYSIEWVKIRLDDGQWLSMNESEGNISRFDHFWERGKLTPDSHSYTVRAFDGFDSVDLTYWFQVGILYDLTITDIQIPTGVELDDWVNFTVVVKNTGAYASPPIDLILYIGDIMRPVNGLSIPANSNMNVRISWHAKAGNHTISAEINPTQKNDETDPTNNVYAQGDYLYVEDKKTGGTSDDTDLTSMLMGAAVIAIILGIVAAAAFISGGKKKKNLEQPPPSPPQQRMP